MRLRTRFHEYPSNMEWRKGQEETCWDKEENQFAIASRKIQLGRGHLRGEVRYLHHGQNALNRSYFCDRTPNKVHANKIKNFCSRNKEVVDEEGREEGKPVGSSEGESAKSQPTHANRGLHLQCNLSTQCSHPPLGTDRRFPSFPCDCALKLRPNKHQ